MLPVTSLPTGDEFARRDDLRRGVGELYSWPLRRHVAASIAEVMPVLRGVERAARAGRWCVGFVSYEAAPAFDDRMVVPCGDPRLPLVFFVEFARRLVVPPVALPSSEPDFRWVREGGRAWFRDAVEKARGRIRDGDFYQVNLTDRLRGTFAGAPTDVYAHLCHRQRAADTVLLETRDMAIACASPESFFALYPDCVVARPMKGTAARAPRLDGDLRSAEELHTSDKDRAENVMIVDLIRNDLSLLSDSARDVEVDALCEVERYDTVWQMVSSVRVRTPAPATLTEVFTALFPCGSVTGAPKLAAMEFVTANEPWPRGAYCGAIGVIGPQPDGATARFQVGIRTATLDKVSGEFEYGSGGGITYQSVPSDEDSELEVKALVLAKLPPAFSLIETLRVERSGARNWDRHRHRLCSSAAYFGFSLGVDRLDAMIRSVVATGSETGARRLRITLHRDGTIDLDVEPLSEATCEVRLAVARNAVNSTDPFTCHKTTNRSMYEQAISRYPMVDDVLLGNERDEITESTIANVLYLLDGQWFVPPLSSGGLDGVGRALLLDAGTISERVLRIDELKDCEAIELVSSLRGRRKATVEILPDT